MLAELLKGRRVRPDETDAFSKLTHDKDLCPQFKTQVETMLQVYRAYGQDVHDIQGMRDDGIDVLLRYETQDGTQRRVGLQVKSEAEFQQWADKKLALPQLLKAQYATAIENVGLNDFYVLLCVNATRHKKRIRMLCSEMKKFKVCTIIEPIYILDFYEMGYVDLWGRATRLLCNNDTILKKATDEVDERDADVAFFLVALVCKALGEGYHVSDADLNDLWTEWLEFSEEDAGSDRLAVIVDDLSEEEILKYEGGIYLLQVHQLPPGLCALYFDQSIRMPGLHPDVRSQMLSLLELRDRLMIDE
ncbi:hypothetical protein [Mesorhizobium sp. L103C131B0]|uniref:hypothetical protein n=1 Tax=Mesorhizobium sp. L103C131B0 TaxID=1287089 RepID=UPI0012DD2607|nr:hypothetical protein [Mesorhizobium sp. L103C131B0]